MKKLRIIALITSVAGSVIVATGTFIGHKVKRRNALSDRNEGRLLAFDTVESYLRGIYLTKLGGSRNAFAKHKINVVDFLDEVLLKEDDDLSKDFVLGYNVAVEEILDKIAKFGALEVFEDLCLKGSVSDEK
jgi:hypothetical protein